MRSTTESCSFDCDTCDYFEYITYCSDLLNLDLGNNFAGRHMLSYSEKPVMANSSGGGCGIKAAVASFKLQSI